MNNTELRSFLREARSRRPELTILENEPMSRHCSFRIGGACDAMLLPSSIADVEAVCALLAECGEKPFLMGNGTNLLVTDAPLHRIVLRMGEEFSRVDPVSGTALRAESGATLSRLASFAAARGLCAVRARCVIDCTGNGDVAAAAGCSFDIGRSGDGRLQPMTLEFALDNVDADAITVWGGSDPIKIPGGEFGGMEFRELCKLKNREGELPENVTIVRLHHALRPDVRIVNATQENNADPLDPAAVAGAELSLRAQIGVCAAFLRKYIPGYENCRVTDSADTVGVRESRRIKGMDSVCDADVENGRMREDAVVHNAWFLIDIHNPAGGGQAEGHSHPAQPYDIPYGALVPCDAGGLLVAGRCISGTHRAHASYRVMSICMSMGEAAGVAAAIAAERRVDPADIPAEDIRAELRSRGIEL